MGWIVEIWCEDCTGVDPMGCGGGCSWRLDDDDSPSDAAVIFESQEAAEQAGDDAVNDCSPWRYRVIELPS